MQRADATNNCCSRITSCSTSTIRRQNKEKSHVQSFAHPLSGPDECASLPLPPPRPCDVGLDRGNVPDVRERRVGSLPRGGEALATKI